ncbi:uncharacterized protein LOC143716187 isoform X5 [Siphateles boraxobius]|uniref:uncharacterized protein LOC143716187 isoform X5 n=1 Tax=Siphateles boraxobius TaxID=180520 RepID=UPI00406467A7
MSLLESEVVSVLETLVKDTVKEITTFVDLSGIPPLTETTANESVSLDFTTHLNCVLERNAKEAVEKICQLFSALQHLETTPSAQDSLKTTLKQTQIQQKTLQGETNLTDSALLRSQSSDQLTLVSTEEIIVSWEEEEEIIDTEHVRTPIKTQKTVIIKDEKSADCSENGNHSLFVALQDSDDEEESRTLSILKSKRDRLRCRKKEKAFSCKHCKRKFDSLVLLRAHRVIHSAGEKTFSCSQCVIVARPSHNINS